MYTVCSLSVFKLILTDICVQKNFCCKPYLCGYRQFHLLLNTDNPDSGANVENNYSSTTLPCFVSIWFNM